MKAFVIAFALSLAIAPTVNAQISNAPVIWTSNGTPVEAQITGGPWTLEQSGAAVGLKSAGYCNSLGNQIGNPGTERMQPYYFPFISGLGSHLQGYFDWRPKDTDEAIAAAFSEDAGFTWTFQQKALELRTTCPNQAQRDPYGDKDYPVQPNNSDNGDDDGQGHQF